MKAIRATCAIKTERGAGYCFAVRPTLPTSAAHRKFAATTTVGFWPIPSQVAAVAGGSGTEITAVTLADSP